MINLSLPTWYGQYHFAWQTGNIEESSSNNKASRLWPIEIFNESEGLEGSLFGTNKKSVAVFEGYLFDQAELASRLSIPQANPKEVDLIVVAYEEWGLDLFNHIDGAYLAVIWDAEKREVILGHDGLGKHPLYYVQQRDTLLFSSNIFALSRSGKVSSEPNRVSLGLRILGRWPQAGQTFFQEIKRVRPGHTMQLKEGGQLQEREYWRPFPGEETERLKSDNVLEEFEELLSLSVARHMKLGPTGIFLSGGIDSVIVAAFAKQYTDQHKLPPLIAYSGTNPPGYPFTYEEEMQKLASQKLGMELRPSHAQDWLEGQDLLSATLEESPHLPGPTDVWWTGAYMGFYRRAAREGVSTLLSGSGGDEWLGVHAMHYADMLRHADFRQVIYFLQAEKDDSRFPTRLLTKVLLNYGIRPLAHSIWAKLSLKSKQHFHLRKHLRSLPDWFSPDEKLRNSIVEAALSEGRIPDLDANGRVPKNYYLHALNSKWNNPLITYEFERGFHTNGHLGMKRLNPFHDRALAEFSSRIPPMALMEGKFSKGLLRPLATKHLPGFGLEKQRKIYDSPEETFTAKALRENLTRSYVATGVEQLAKLGLVNKDHFSLAVEGAGKQKIGNSSALFTCLSSEKWLDNMRT